MKERLFQLVDEHSGPGRRFAWFIQFLIIGSMVTFTIQTLPEFRDRPQPVFDIIELAVIAIFTLEYVLRVAAAADRRRFVFSFYGIIDLLAIAPYYLAAGLDLRSLRILRVFRLLYLLKLFRYNRAVRRLANAFYRVREELVLFGLMVILLLYLAAVGIYYFENEAQPEAFQSVLHSMWWAVATLTTVGYGDIFPVTAGGKLFTFIVLIVGLGIVAVPTGLVASALTEARGEEADADSSEEAGSAPTPGGERPDAVGSGDPG